ncbi:MAG: hypothetical protein OXR66_02080 [Candidatus Woesearchaeota archaeon]|nr:hypothetical protein [Candidatus Woesearchaeota archaeon]
MAKKRTNFWAKLGVWSYVAGLLVALFVAFFADSVLEPWVIGTLGGLGVLVGLINIAESEVRLFLLGAVAFIISAQAMSEYFLLLGHGFDALMTFMHAIVIFTAPGALVVSFKALYEVAKDE